VCRTTGTDMTVVVSCAALMADHPDAPTIASILQIDTEIAIIVMDEVERLGLETRPSAEKAKREQKAPVDEKRATRLPDDWTLMRKDGLYARELGFTDLEIRSIAGDFKAYWLSTGRRMVNWSMTWQGWVRREAQKRGKRIPDDPSLFAGTAAAPDDKAEMWRRSVQAWVKSRTWTHALGPEPREPGCKVPAEILREFGI